MAIKSITDVVFDFDGTCTQIPIIYNQYLEQFRLKFGEEIDSLTEEEWQMAQQMVRLNSPNAGWTIGGCSAAPAAADPYILADESAKYILRRRNKKNTSPSATINAQAYAANPAPWRDDALTTFTKLIENGIRLHFISNSSTSTIQDRLLQLFGVNHPALVSIKVQSDAAKFRICELPWDNINFIDDYNRRKFVSLPVAYQDAALKQLERPAYLRRGAYFEAIYQALEGDMSRLESSVFCGDIWEMDLAMPHALGANVHLLERAEPYPTYAYERQAIESYGQRAKISANLSSILEWL